jgi:GMP synthase-like glutamine amidotransferase
VRVLSVTHGPSVPGGVFEHEVEERGHRLERWSAPDGAAPASARSYGAVLVFGGAAHPDQDDHFAWLRDEKEFLKEALVDEVPVLGVCLGAQMLARAAGAEVRPAPAAEVGWLDVALTAHGSADPVLGALPRRATVFQWHHYTYDLPPGGVELATSDVCTQAFRLAQPAWGIQFHAEVTLPMVAAWAEEAPDELPLPADALLRESRERIAESNRLGRALCAGFLRAAEAQAGDMTSSTTSFAADA